MGGEDVQLHGGSARHLQPGHRPPVTCAGARRVRRRRPEAQGLAERRRRALQGADGVVGHRSGGPRAEDTEDFGTDGGLLGRGAGQLVGGPREQVAVLRVRAPQASRLRV